VTPYQAYVEMLLLRAGSEAVDVRERVKNGEHAEPRLVDVATRAAIAVLECAGYGRPSRGRKAIKTAHARVSKFQGMDRATAP
jgi:hypothetical protein